MAQNNTKNTDDKIKLKVIAEVQHELGKKATPADFSVYISLLLWLNYDYKIEYGIIRFSYMGKEFYRGHTWCESKSGEIIDVSLFIDSHLKTVKGYPIYFVKRPILFGQVLDETNLPDLNGAQESKDCHAEYIQLPIYNKQTKQIFIEYFPQPEVINHAIQTKKISDQDFKDISEIITLSDKNTIETSKTKAKDYVRSQHTLLGAALNKFTKLKLKYI